MKNDLRSVLFTISSTGFERNELRNLSSHNENNILLNKLGSSQVLLLTSSIAGNIIYDAVSANFGLQPTALPMSFDKWIVGPPCTRLSLISTVARSLIHLLPEPIQSNQWLISMSVLPVINDNKDSGLGPMVFLAGLEKVKVDICKLDILVEGVLMNLETKVETWVADIFPVVIKPGCYTMGSVGGMITRWSKQSSVLRDSILKVVCELKRDSYMANRLIGITPE